jgi:serine phosphatase RsbU (regulator of sigma subunit)
MIERILDVLRALAIGMPLMAIVSESFRIWRNGRYTTLALCYVLLAVNEVAFMGLGIPFYYYHMLLDSVLITVAAAALFSGDPNRLVYVKANLPVHFVLGFGLAATTVVFHMSAGRDKILAAVDILLVVFCNGFIMLRSTEENRAFYSMVLLTWLVCHFGMHLHHPVVNSLLTAGFFGTLATTIAREVLFLNRRILQENSLLIRARDVVLSMLNDISSSVKNISSVDYTLNRVLETMVETLAVEGAAVYTVDQLGADKKFLRFSQSSGLFWPMHAEVEQVFTRQSFVDEHLRKTPFQMGEGVVGIVAEREEMLSLDRENDSPRMKDLGLNTRNIRNLLAVPLKVKEQVLGVLVVQNLQDNESFGPNDIHLLQALGDQAAISINNVHMYAELARTDRIRQEMTIATEIQRRLLPETVPDRDNLKIATFIQPAKEVGGDYYDFIDNKDGSLGIVIGDVSGKGLPAGMIMIIARTVLQIVARDRTSAKDIVGDFSREMYPRMGRGQFMTLNFLLWEEAARMLRYSGAGHEHILWFHGNTGRTEKIRAGGMAVGLTEDPSAIIKQSDLQTQPGDVILLYTDGITEARNDKDEMYTLRALQTSFESHARLVAPDKILDRVMDDVRAFAGDTEQYDDITLLVLSVAA